jgi:hypothetical protein
MALNQTKTLSNLAIQVNGVAVRYIPNTLTTRDGGGERKVMAYTAGGNSVSYGYAEDITTRKGFISFQIAVQEFDIQNLKNWKANKFSNSIVLSDAEIGYSVTMQQACLINQPEISYNADGVISVEFEGTPLR